MPIQSARVVRQAIIGAMCVRGIQTGDELFWRLRKKTNCVELEFVLNLCSLSEKGLILAFLLVVKSYKYSRSITPLGCDSHPRLQQIP
jgi:hypothetical protein